MQPSLLFLTGAPGTGKSTLMRHIIPAYEEGTPFPGVGGQKLPFILYPTMCELGGERDGYRGLDVAARHTRTMYQAWLMEDVTQAYNSAEWVILMTEAVCKEPRPERVLFIAESGDTCATPLFWNAFLEAGWRVHLWMTECSDEVADKRMEERATAGHRLANPQWIRGRRTRMRNILKEFPNVCRVKTDGDLEQAIHTISNDPILQDARRLLREAF